MPYLIGTLLGIAMGVTILCAVGAPEDIMLPAAIVGVFAGMFIAPIIRKITK